MTTLTHLFHWRARYTQDMPVSPHVDIHDTSFDFTVAVQSLVTCTGLLDTRLRNGRAGSQISFYWLLDGSIISNNGFPMYYSGGNIPDHEAHYLALPLFFVASVAPGAHNIKLNGWASSSHGGNGNVEIKLGSSHYLLKVQTLDGVVMQETTGPVPPFG